LQQRFLHHCWLLCSHFNIKNGKMIKRNRIVIIAFIIVLISLVGYIGNKIYQAFKSNERAFAEDLPITYKMPKEDSALILAKYYDRIKVIQVRNSKVRNHVSQLIFDDKYPLFIYKIDSTGILSLRDSFIIENIKTDRTTGITYNILDNGFYKFQYKAGTVGNPSFLYLTVVGDTIQQFVRNDSIVLYNLVCQNMSIRYNEDDPVDIFIEGKQKGFYTLRIPMSILFLKRKKNTYLLVLTTDSSNLSLPSGILYSIVFDR
jgi:hypothetical protein